ncbi:ABC transporter substrate-binding protein [Demequina iriomotensis]|uniref:ABC transporter substrate-binding protein n=1 Tax=Demequina iriomotensis TaxID=1536641 RepID=UPI00078166C8|nr:ABC transporter substrate-binding protein [Demequina iriomotensis]
MQVNTPLRRQVRRSVAAAIAAGAVFTLGACSGASDPAASPTTGTSESGAPAADAPTTLAIATNRAPSTFDPVGLATGNDALIWGSIYDTLFVIGPDGELVPHLATGYSYSDDGLELTVTLRDDLTFSDGTPATAAEYKATLEHIRDTAGAGQAMADTVASVEAADATTVVITFSANDPGFLFDLTSRVGIIAQPDKMADESYGLDPIGAGPYMLDAEKTQSGTQYVLIKRDDYWNADAYPFEEVTVRVIADATAIENSLRAGELDIAGVQAQTAPQFESSGDFTTTQLEAQSSLFLDIADRDGAIEPAFADLRVRQAINFALNRDGFVQAGGGVGQPAYQMDFPSTSGYDPALDSVYTYDVEKAKSLLAEAGYAEGFSIDMPSLVYTTSMEPAITQALADIGITVNWDSIPPQDTVQALLSGKYPVILWFASTLPDANQVQDFYAPAALLNPMHTTDPELDALLEQASKITDPAAGADIYKQINAFGVNNAWYAPLMFTGQTFAEAEGYKYVGTSAQQSVRIESYGVAG